MSKSNHTKPVVPAGRRGWFSLPAEAVELCLNPAESTLYRLFLAHPEGLLADDLVLHWQELSDIYARESRFDDPDLRENALVSLCSESKRVFYANISRIKRKFIDAIGARKAAGYYIKRYSDGLYRTRAVLPCSSVLSPTAPSGPITGPSVSFSPLFRHLRSRQWTGSSVFSENSKCKSDAY